ncbi:hypothetical protein D1006_28610 [Burkholderia stabilis]|uniref:Uncharacterized protein n=1 Tax=Burkholderia stabilis TaxID=95485 RepID=A0A4Q2AHS5_9BURK|nr:hypothetical protein D1006_28610 [Burkholderia stabilis]
MASGTSLVPNQQGSRGGSRHTVPARPGRGSHPGIPGHARVPHRTLSRGLFRFGAHSTSGYLENFPDVYRFRIRRNILVGRTAAAATGQPFAVSSRRGSLEDDQGNSG